MSSDSSISRDSCQSGGGPKSLTKKGRVTLPASRSSARVAKNELFVQLSKMGLYDGPVRPATYVPSLPAPSKDRSNMDNLDKKKAKGLFELAMELHKKTIYIKNEEVVAKIRADLKKVADTFMVRQQQEIEELKKMKTDLMRKVAAASAPSAPAAPAHAHASPVATKSKSKSSHDMI